MHEFKHNLSSKSMGQFPQFRYNPQETSPSSSSLLHSPNQSRDRVSISNLINAVDNARITSNPSSPAPSSPSSPLTDPPESQENVSAHLLSSSLIMSRESARSRSSGSSATSKIRASSAQSGRKIQQHHNSNPSQQEDQAARRKKLQSEKKRLWRKNLSPDQKAKRQELDAQRKREQRMNMTPEQRSEARRKDAARKAAKRRLQKEQNMVRRNDHSTNPNSIDNCLSQPSLIDPSASSSSSIPSPSEVQACKPSTPFPDQSIGRKGPMPAPPQSSAEYRRAFLSHNTNNIHNLLN